jgi:signal transduction histidine kinase/DNA-binding NarL/FixJ family response regulator
MKPSNIILLEDDAADSILTCRALEHGGVAANITVAHSRAAYEQALNAAHVDLVISDCSIPNLPLSEAMTLIAERHPDASFIVLSGAIDRRITQQVRNAGALAWLEKNDLTQLIPVVKQALEQQRVPQAPTAEPKSSGQQLIMEKTAALRLVQAVKELSAARDLASIQEIVRHAARELNGADGATFVLRENDLCFYADENAIAPLWKGQRFPMSACISGWAMLNHQAAVVEDIEKDVRIPLDAYRPTFVRSLVMVPIRREAPIGAIGNYWATRRKPTAAEVNLIQALADATSIALENVRVYQELEDRVASRTAELIEANQALEEFSYFVSHDLRAPLRHIRAFGEILKEEAADTLSPTATRALEHIKGSAISMMNLLEGLLTLAHSGQQDMTMDNVDMNELVASSIEELRRSTDTEIAFTAGTLPDAYGDRVLLRQVWVNLISNAVKYSSERPQPEVTIGSRVGSNGHTIYFVRDNGVGFDQNDADLLFNPFTRLESGRMFSGSGIGLAIVHKIIGRHDGRIWAEASPGRGATFFFSI